MTSLLSLSDFLKRTETIPLIDVRSEGEYEQGHIPGSINIPLLNNDHRKIVGTIYKQEGKEKAVLKGFELVGPLFAQKAVAMKEAALGKELLIHCWRGGMRSEIMAWIARMNGLNAHILEGGYKVFRTEVIRVNTIPLKGCLLSGHTGSGKTELLHRLKNVGIPILDLEGYANHKGSSFGGIGKEQRSQEMFENLLAFDRMHIGVETPVVLEDESRMIGTKCIPVETFNTMKALPKLIVEVTAQQRIARIATEYAFMDKPLLEAAITRLEKRLGNERMKTALTFLQDDNHAAWIEIMLAYYDKAYAHERDNTKADKVKIPFDWNQIESSLARLLSQVKEHLK